jgi:hypothetical protein
VKVAVGHRIQEGPYGGGNAFVRNLSKALTDAGHQVSFDLDVPDLDFILMTDPRRRSPNVSFAAAAILRYLTRNDSRALVVHRINECDERKGTKYMNRRLRLANYCADHTVIVGSWLKKLDLFYERPVEDTVSVILNGGNTSIFHPRGYRPWDGRGPMRLVTHHWGFHWMKGFDVYAQLDALLGSPQWGRQVAFTYIGNLPRGFAFRNARYVPPLGGQALADEIRRHHVYLSASLNEPGGNHQVEGGLCGLPLIYRDSGCLPEYCDGFGIMFKGADIAPAIEEMLRSYQQHLGRMANFPHTAECTTSAYISLFGKLIDRRDEILDRRRARHSLLAFALNQLWI